MKRILHTLFLFFIFHNTNSQQGKQLSSGPGEYRVGVSYASSLMPVNDKYVLELAGSERITLDTGHRIVYFIKKFKAGETFRVRQISVPRPSNLTVAGPADSVATGVVTNADVLILFYCTPPPLTMVSINITGLDYDEPVAFNDNYGRSRSLVGSGTISLGGFPVGDPLVVKQTGGYRPCIITPGSATVPANPVSIQCDCTRQTTTTAEYKVGVAYGSSLFSNMEKYEFTLNGGEKVEMNAANPTVYFTQKLKPGQTYRISQVSGPRACGFFDQQVGTVSNQDIVVTASCGNPPLTINRANFRGIETGESFSFADSHGRSMTIPFSTNTNLGGYPIGDSMSLRQTGGPRPCIITPHKTIVTATAITVDCDCRKKPKEGPPPTPPKNTYDLVTRSSDDKILNTYYESWTPVIGGKGGDEGRYVAFSMYGKDIDSSSGNYRQIFWRDRKLGITKLVSKSIDGKEGDGNSALPAIAADGKSVAFESYAKNLCDGDINGGRDVFVWNATTGKVVLVSKGMSGGTANAESTEPVISGDGSVVAYTSNASNIVQLEPVFSTPNVYVHDIRSGSTVFITKDYETGKAAGGYSPTISDDGTKVAFCAFTYRLTANDKNNLWDIFLWQKSNPLLKRISMTAAGGERNQGDESASRVVFPALSGNGEYIAFATTSSNIVNDDNNKVQDIFLYNTATSAIKRISSLNNTIEGDGDSPVGQGEKIGISYDGTWITYNTNATNLGVPKGNIVIQNTTSGKIIPITQIVYGSTARPMLSRFGNYVVAGCSEPYDKRFSSSGIFTIFTNAGACNTCED